MLLSECAGMTSEASPNAAALAYPHPENDVLDPRHVPTSCQHTELTTKPDHVCYLKVKRCLRHKESK